MNGRQQFLPLARRLAAFGASGRTVNSYPRLARRQILAVSGVDRSISVSRRKAATEPSFFRKEQCRYYGARDENDDESHDAIEQKTAFLRALEGKNEKRNRKRSGHRNTTTVNRNPGDMSKRAPENRRRNGDHNNYYSRATTSSGSSKRLTLDEFFSDLAKQSTEESNSKFGTKRISRTRPYGKGGQQRKNKRRRDQQRNSNNNNNRMQSRPTMREAPAPGLGSFFDEVDALMERNQKEKEEIKEKGWTKASMPSIETRPSIADIISPLPPISRATAKDGGAATDGEDGVSFHPFTQSGDESFDQYNELLEEIMEGPKFLVRLQKKKTINDDDNNEERNRQIQQIVEWLRSEVSVIETRLPTLSNALKGEDEIVEATHAENGITIDEKRNGITNATIADVSADRSARFREELSDQKERFTTEMGWTKGQYDVASGALVALGGLCAKRCMASPLDVAWSKLKEMGYPMRNKDVLHNYLYVSSTFSLPKRRNISTNNKATPNLGWFVGEERIENDYLSESGEDGSSLSALDLLNGTSTLPSNVDGDEEEIEEDGIDVSAEVALCHDFFHEPTEQSIGIHVRRLVHLGKANEAERLLEATMKSDDLRLRTYAPIYQSYLDQGDISSAFKLFVKMSDAENVLLQTETYVQLIAGIAENGYFRLGAEEISDIENLHYSVKSGPELFNELASELAEHSVEITSASTKRLYNAFQRGFKGHDSRTNLKQLHLLESLRVENDLAKPDELIASRVRIDETTGKCARSGSQLRLINLDSAQKKKFRDGLLYLVSSSYQERHRNARKVDVAEKLKRFGDWLQKKDGKSFTAIIDGPNIAYYMQNFQQGTFNYHQIKFVADALENMGEKILVVLPKKYTYDSFTIQVGGRTVKQTLSLEEKQIRDDLLSKGKACVVPVGSLDDYYWMFASVSMDEEFVPPNNAEGRWPGNRPMLISNDKLRDHKMSLLEPRLFRRWYSNFLVNFTFSAFVNDECTDREIGFRTADFYSREIQGNSDENGTTWHFPVTDWDENESMCIRIPTKKGAAEY